GHRPGLWLHPGGGRGHAAALLASLAGGAGRLRDLDLGRAVLRHLSRAEGRQARPHHRAARRNLSITPSLPWPRASTKTSTSRSTPCAATSCARRSPSSASSWAR